MSDGDISTLAMTHQMTQPEKSKHMDSEVHNVAFLARLRIGDL